MKLDQTLIAIRPRSILERLDLTFSLCGRHPVGIFLSLFLGAVPWMLFNWWLLSETIDDDSLFFFVIAILPIEVALSTVFLTLYLGQLTFSRSFSIRIAAQTLVRQSLNLFLYQVLLRGIICVTLILQPFVWLGMYHMNEILLLERASLLDSWIRRSVLHDSRVGDIIASRFIEIVVFLIGFVFLLSTIGILSSLWNDNTSITDILLMSQEMSEGENVLMTWQVSVAFFLTTGFLKIFGFVTYLDSRIRYEGWDVELKLRSVARAYS